MRKNIVAGNWKMNKTLDAALQLAREVKDLVNQIDKPTAEVIFCVPSLYLMPIKKILRDGSSIQLGAQNSAAFQQGAYTGEIAADMLASAEIPYVILGHSERRMLFGDSDSVVKTKVDLALSAGLKPIFCCGEPLETREANGHEALIKSQIENSLFHLSAEQMRQVVVAYEPVWAIGTGRTATAEQAQEMHAFIRSLLAKKYDSSLAEDISILYGGSVKASNAAEIFGKPDVDGGLIGGAALVAEEFFNIIKCA